MLVDWWSVEFSPPSIRNETGDLLVPVKPAEMDSLIPYHRWDDLSETVKRASSQGGAAEDVSDLAAASTPLGWLVDPCKSLLELNWLSRQANQVPFFPQYWLRWWRYSFCQTCCSKHKFLISKALLLLDKLAVPIEVALYSPSLFPFQHQSVHSLVLSTNTHLYIILRHLSLVTTFFAAIASHTATNTIGSVQHCPLTAQRILVAGCSFGINRYSFTSHICGHLWRVRLLVSMEVGCLGGEF